MDMLRRLLLGKPLATHDLPHQAVSKTVGLAVFASDAISSTAYATQEMLIVLSIVALSATGHGGLWQENGQILGLSLPIAIAIGILLVIVTISYRQTIYAYPNGGGAYIVARDNLGEIPALIAGSALLTDYILTVAVSISSGVDQIISAFPGLSDFRVAMAVGFILLITVVNLRGVKESGRIFAVPTYFFVVMMFLTLFIGYAKWIGGTLGVIDPTGIELFHHVNEVAPSTNLALIFLVLRAFSSGCTALTGIEAISNGITAFKEPKSRNAATTLIWMSTILVVLFLGITALAIHIQAVPSHTKTVIAQLGQVVFGLNSLPYFLVLAGTALILLMAANTSYADFPRLAALQAADGFLPRQLTHRGGRLVFSWGIAFLAAAAIILVVMFQANVTNLIPLYAIGVFLSFTLSQAGMAVRSYRIGKLKPGEHIPGLDTKLEHDVHWRKHMLVSAVGAFCTSIVMVIFAVTKFTHGAWFILFLIPVLVLLFSRIHNHYKSVAHALSLSGKRPDIDPRNVVTWILVDDVHAETAQLVNFAKSLRHPWKAVHVGINPDKVERIKQRWEERIGEGTLVILPSPYRQLAEPIEAYIKQQQTEHPDGFIHIIMGHLVMDSFWEQVLHQNSSFIFNLALSRFQNVVVTTVPYQIHRNGNGSGEHTEQLPIQGSTESVNATSSPVH